MPNSANSEAEALIDAAIDAAPACVRQRMFLQTVDWGKVRPAKISRLFERLGEEGVALPPWLARALLLGGHALAAELHEGLAPSHRALNTINRCRQDAASLQGLEAAVGDLAVADDLDSELVVSAVRALASKGQAELARRLALAHWPRVPRALRFIKKDLAAQIAGYPVVKLRLLGYSTTHALAEDLVPAFAAVGWRAEVQQANFGEVIAELLRPVAGPDAYLVVLDYPGFHTRDWRIPSEAAAALLEEKLASLASAIEHFAREGQRPLLITTLPAPASPIVGLIDNRHPGGMLRSIELINQRLAELAERHSQIVVVDADLALASVAATERSDPRLWFYGRVPYSADATRALAVSAAEAWHLLKRGPAKVLALDLDNTLWGGVFGDDGLAGLACGDDPPGNVFKALQEECLRLKSQGMLLALVSKNSPDAISAFKEHPGMLLREDDFAATAINWDPKPENIRKLAGELNLGLDSFVFIDDSPHEREAMRLLCPSVIVPELPNEPERRPEWLRRLAVTWPVLLTAEDERRSDMYLAEKSAKALMQQSGSFEDYLAGLEQRLIVERASPRTRARVAQLHIRTNQFNLTSVRYGEAEIEAMMADEANYAVLLGRVLDKFGDHGIVICATARLNGETAQIDSFLMSCRVIGREVDRAFLGELISHISERGIKNIEAAYVPTAKNGIVRDFYQSQGFIGRGKDGDRCVWGWTPHEADRPHSEFVTVQWRG